MVDIPSNEEAVKQNYVAVGYLDCCCTGQDNSTAAPSNLREVLVGSSGPVEKKERGGQLKDFAEVRDLESTGRKRAAKLFPIPKEGEPRYPLACEWRGMVAAGGGVIPIVGCVDGLAKAIHHGPDKNTLSNFVGNVHRICKTCHNRWHTINDQYYSGERPNGDLPYVPLEEYDFVDHSLERATQEQLALSEAAWGMKDAASYLHNLLQTRKLNPLTE